MEIYLFLIILTYLCRKYIYNPNFSYRVFQNT